MPSKPPSDRGGHKPVPAASDRTANRNDSLSLQSRLGTVEVTGSIPFSQYHQSSSLVSHCAVISDNACLRLNRVPRARR